MAKKGKKRRISEAKRKEILQAYERIGTYYGVAKELGVDPKTVSNIVEVEKSKREKTKKAKPSKIDWPKLARLLEAGDVPTIMAEFNLGPEELKREIDRYATLKEAVIKVSAYSESAAKFTKSVKPLIHWYFEMGERKRDACHYFKEGLCTRWSFKQDELPALESLGHEFGKDEAGLIRMKREGLDLACPFCFTFVPKEALMRAKA